MRSAVIAGALLDLAFTVLFVVLVRAWFINPSSDSQVAAFLAAAPLSGWLFSMVEPLLDAAGGLGTRHYEVSTWVYLLVCGEVQWLAIGFGGMAPLGWWRHTAR
jgi:hypothetical protein